MSRVSHAKSRPNPLIMVSDQLQRDCQLLGPPGSGQSPGRFSLYTPWLLNVKLATDSYLFRVRVGGHGWI